MTIPPRKPALVAAFIMGLGPYVVLPASATDWYQPGNPTQHEIERGDKSSDDYRSDLYGTD